MGEKLTKKIHLLDNLKPNYQKYIKKILNYSDNELLTNKDV